MPGTSGHTARMSARQTPQGPSSDERAAPVHKGRAIVVAISAHVVYVLGLGVLRCSGVFYNSWLRDFEADAWQTGAIGSVIGSCTFFGSPLAAVACDRYGCRLTGILSGMVMAICLLGTQWVRTIYHMYAVCAIAGLGLAFAFMAANVAVIQHFKKYFALANSFVMSGVGVGMIVQPLLFGLLLDRYSWRGALLIFAGILGNICVAAAMFRPAFRPRSRGQRRVWNPRLTNSHPNDLELEFRGDQGRSDTSSGDEEAPCIRESNKRALPLDCLSKALASLGIQLLRRNGRFALFCLLQVQLCAAYSAFHVFIVPWAESIDLEVARAATLLSVLGIGSLAGRLASGCLISTRLTAGGVFAGSALACFVGALGAQLGSYWGLAASAGLVGLGTGVMKAAHNVLVRDLVGVACYGRGLGTADMFRGIGDLLGPIIAGRLFDDTGSYSVMFYVIAALFLATVLQLALLMAAMRRHDLAGRRNSRRNAESEDSV